MADFEYGPKWSQKCPRVKDFKDFSKAANIRRHTLSLMIIMIKANWFLTFMKGFYKSLGHLFAIRGKEMITQSAKLELTFFYMTLIWLPMPSEVSKISRTTTYDRTLIIRAFNWQVQVVKKLPLNMNRWTDCFLL